MFFVILLQVAHFEPETVNLRGEGIFPRIFLNLPRFSVAGEYEQLLCVASENLLKEANKTALSRPSSAYTRRDEQAHSDEELANSGSVVILITILFFSIICKPSSVC